jgi:hypothetical protein
MGRIAARHKGKLPQADFPYTRITIASAAGWLDTFGR